MRHVGDCAHILLNETGVATRSDLEWRPDPDRIVIIASEGKAAFAAAQAVHPTTLDNLDSLRRL